VTVGCAALGARTNFTLLDGTSHPAEMVATAAMLGHASIGICDRNSLAGVVSARVAAKDNVLDFRKTRSQGAYCATCKLGVPMENPAAIRPSIATNSRSRHSLSRFLPVWLRFAPARTGGVRWV
jgi:hypothetical protein